MRGDVSYKLATPAATLHVAKNLRQCDRIEVRLSSGPDEEARVMLSYLESTLAWNAFIDDEPVNVFGVTDIGHGMGSPWMVGTDRMLTRRRELLVDAQRVVSDMNSTYPFLINFVHAENRTSIAWLKRLGFSVDPAVPYGPHLAPFHPFYRHPHV